MPSNAIPLRVEPRVTRNALWKYAEVVSMWRARFDTYQIAVTLDLPEHLVARWVANFREMLRETSRDA